MAKEENENSDLVLNKYFAEASREPLVVSELEVEKILASGEINNINQPAGGRFQYWIIGGIFFLFVTAFFVMNRNHEIKNNASSKNATELPKTKTANQNEAKQSSASAAEFNEAKIVNDKNENKINNANPASSIREPGMITPGRKVNTSNEKTNDDAAKLKASASTDGLSDSKAKTEYHFQGDATINFEGMVKM